MSKTESHKRDRDVFEKVKKEEINGAINEVSTLINVLEDEGIKNNIENIEKKVEGLEKAFGELMIAASSDDEDMKSIAEGVKNRKDRRKNAKYIGGRKQTGGDGCTPFRKNLIKLIIIAGLLGGASLGAGAVSRMFDSFFTKAIELLSDDMKASIDGLSKAAINYIGVYIRATIDSLRISIQTNNRSIWEAFLSSLNWTNFGKVTAGIATIRTVVVPAVSNTCGVANTALDSIVDGICSELETKTAELGTQTDSLSDTQEADAKEQGNKITKYFTRSCVKGGRKSRRRSIKKNRKTRRKTSSKKTNKKRRRSKRKTSRR